MEKMRQIYTHDMLHAVHAYLGKRKGYEYLSECIHDKEIQQVAVHCLEESSQALQAEYGFSESDMQEWNARVIKNLANQAMKEGVDRVGADPVRKLQQDNCLTGPALLCRKHGILPYYLAIAIAHALLFDGQHAETSEKLRAHAVSTHMKDAIRMYCQLEREVELIQLIAQQYEGALRQQSLITNEEGIAKVKKAYHLGFQYEKIYKGCAQCTLAAMFKITGKEEKAVFQAASGLAGGMGLCGDGVCGGYSGGIMLMSSLVGRRIEYFDNDQEHKRKSFEMAQRLHDKFLDTYGSVICSGVHNQIFGKAYCLRDHTVKDEFEAAGAHTVKCTTVVATAAQWVTEILLEENLL